MKKISNFITYLSVALNLYFNLSWLYCFNKFDVQTERTNYFTENFIFGLPVLAVSLALIFLTIISLSMLIFYKLKNEVFRTALLVLQAIFLIIYLWQSL
jgi:hypothetical protein